MGFGEWLKQPFLWLGQGWTVARGKAASGGSAALALLEHPKIYAIILGCLAGFCGGAGNNLVSRINFSLPSIPWHFPIIPTPKPPAPPAPIPAKGLHVLITVDSNNLSKLPVTQQLELSSADVRSYLDKTCPVGPDGKTHEWRIWDKSVNAANESPLWQEALKRSEGKPTPWIIVSNGTTGFEGALPPNSADLLTLLKKYGG